MPIFKKATLALVLAASAAAAIGGAPASAHENYRPNRGYYFNYDNGRGGYDQRHYDGWNWQRQWRRDHEHHHHNQWSQGNRDGYRYDNRSNGGRDGHDQRDRYDDRGNGGPDGFGQRDRYDQPLGY
jgi:hypothetical protein